MQISIFSFYQDEIGAMWFNHLKGLNRYNDVGLPPFALHKIIRD